jgi:HEPN domain-containing protein
LPRKTDSNCPADWLFMAGADLKAIRKLVAARIGFHLCRSKLAEVLEKILKAELIRLGWFLQKTHDLQKLADELSERKSDLLECREELVEALAESYFADRYPGFDLDDPDWRALAQNVRKVTALMRVAKSNIEKKARNFK